MLKQGNKANKGDIRQTNVPKKMKVAHIVPLSGLRIAEKYNDMHLLLYHWCLQSTKYVNFMKRSKIYRIMDNSQYELRKEIDYDDLLRVSTRIGVNEIVAPDIMYDYRKTKRLIESFLPKVPKKMKVQAVVCGKTRKELNLCFDWLNNNESVDVIGISKHGYRVPTLSYYASRTLLVNSVLKKTKKPIHMLGINLVMDFWVKGVRSIDGKWLSNNVCLKKTELFTNISLPRLEADMKLFKETF